MRTVLSRPGASPTFWLPHSETKTIIAILTPFIITFYAILREIVTNTTRIGI